MTKRLLFILCLAFVSCGSVLAQKTVTNADLEKFKQRRLQAEKDYRENYEKLGMPSPEELAKQDEQKRLENAEAAARFRAERLQDEENQSLREQAEAANNYYRQSADTYQPSYTPNNFGYAPYGYFPYGYYNYSFGRRFSQRRYNSGGHFGNQPPPVRIHQSFRPPVLFGNPRKGSRGSH